MSDHRPAAPAGLAAPATPTALTASSAKPPAISGPGRQLTISIQEGDRYEGKTLYHAIVQLLKEEGLAGVTVLRGIEGFRAHGKIHTTSIDVLSADLPLVIVVVDSQEYLDKVLPRLLAMVCDGMVTVCDADVILYSHDGHGGSDGREP